MTARPSLSSGESYNDSHSEPEEPFDPAQFHDPRIELVSTMFKQRMVREARERRKLESQVYCKPSIHQFATCATQRGLLAAFYCKHEHKAMINCFVEYMDHPQLNLRKPDFGRSEVFSAGGAQSVVPPEHQQPWKQEFATMKLEPPKR